MSTGCRVFASSPQKSFCAPCASQIAGLDFTWPLLSGTKVCNLVKRTKDQSDFDLIHVYLKHLLYNWRRKSGGYLISATSALKRKQSHIKHTSHYPDKTFNSVMISVRVRMCAPQKRFKKEKKKDKHINHPQVSKNIESFLLKRNRTIKFTFPRHKSARVCQYRAAPTCIHFIYSLQTAELQIWPYDISKDSELCSFSCPVERLDCFDINCCVL